MKGFVPTPPKVVDLMVDRLFKGRPPTRQSNLLDPGCGHGAFIQGVLRWCLRNNAPCPKIVGIELDPDKLAQARIELKGQRNVTLRRADFLAMNLPRFNYIIGNPPYVPIEHITAEERALYRSSFETARGRLDLYLLFWERALRLLDESGKLVFITPEKFTYVETARPLRKLLARAGIEQLQFAREDTFEGLTTYPTITTICGNSSRTLVQFRDGTHRRVRLPPDGNSWQSVINKSPRISGSRTLADLALRVSCGIATGADKMFLFNAESLPANLARFSRPALAGRELQIGQPLPKSRRVLVMPYSRHGELLPLHSLGALSDYLHQHRVRERLMERTCVKRKPWYSFHETPPLDMLLRPKLLCKDISSVPYFWIEPRGNVVPLHSTYYIVPRSEALLVPLAEFLNSREAVEWLHANCQRAANGYLRLQSSILKRLPIPDWVIDAVPPAAIAA